MLRLHSRCAPNVIGGYIAGKVIQSLQFTQDVPTGFQDTSPPVSSTGMLPISRSSETFDKTNDEPNETLADMSRLVSPDQVDLMDLPRLQLHGRVVSQPPVT